MSDATYHFDPAWNDAALEADLLDELRLDDAWAVLERYATLVRESGSDDERTAARYLADQLGAWGVPHTVQDVPLFLSVPIEARVVIEGDDTPIHATPPAFSTSTPAEGVTSTVVHVPSGYATSTVNVFDAGDATDEPDVAGRIAITEGFANPGKVQRMQELGAIAVIAVNPGAYVHEGICTPIWGAPDDRTAHLQPRLPAVAVSRPDGDRIFAAMNEGKRVTIVTQLDEGWKSCPLVEATIAGSSSSKDFVLLHGHIDSWHVGIGDNATGNATMLEIARVLHHHRDRLRRTVKIAWWPGHSTGRYAGSTWYADRNALEIAEHCVAHVNCDSPGCRDATTYENIMWMAEADGVARAAIRDATGQEATPVRPFRAGDISFNNLGVSTYFMLSSAIANDELQQRGSYPVGGCGMNIEWHTPHDTLDIADRDILMKDLRVYLLGVTRAAHAPLTPLDYRATVHEIRDVVRRYADAADGHVDFTPVTTTLDELERDLDAMYACTIEGEEQALAFDATQRRIARHLVTVNYTQAGRFRQDPALQTPPVPELASAEQLANETQPHRLGVLRTELTRAVNHVTYELREARREVARFLTSATSGGTVTS